MAGNGCMMAEFIWRHRDGYEYRVVPTDEGCWELRYTEDGSEQENVVMFNDGDVDGIIDAIKSAVEFWRANKGPE